MRNRRLLVFLVLIIGGLLSACGTVTQPATTTGKLAVKIVGLPTGVAGAVTVTGPGSYTHTVTSSQTLTVDAGTYAVTAASTSGSAAIVPVMYDGTVSAGSVQVTAGGTGSATVTYTARPGSGSLWIPIAATGIADGYLNNTLAGGGPASADVSLAGTATVYHEAIAFDGSGNMWLSDDNGYITKYVAADLATSGPATPSVTIDATAYGPLEDIAFDAQGDLWAAVHNGTQILMYTPTQLASGGKLLPKVVLNSSVGGAINSPAGLAFDAKGGLWVSDATSSTGYLVRFKPADLTQSGTPSPDVEISADNANSLSRPFGLAFDSKGNLWVADHGNGNVLEYDASQLQASGNPTPHVTITGALAASPTGLAFDNSGDLWVLTPSNNRVVRFANPDSLSPGKVTPTPDITLTIGTVDSGLLAFSPPPSGLPILTP